MSFDYDLIVVGGGISGLTAAYRGQQKGWKVLLREAQAQCGGAIGTHLDPKQGLVMELGAESMVLAKPWGKELCQELGLADQLVSPQPEFRRSLIVRQGKMVGVPEGLRLLAPSQWLPFLRSPALSWAGKLRMALDFLIPRRKGQEDESLADFVRRRLGREALERIAQPLVAGIYTADPETLSMQACLPQFVDFERRYGSVCRGLLFNAEARASSGPRYQIFTSLKLGFGQLISTLESKLEEVRKGTAVAQVRPLESGGWEVDGQTARQLVLALPNYLSAGLMRPWDASAADLLARQEYLSAATVNLIYPREAVEQATRAYGFVVPEVEKRDILACTFSHRKYPGRTPDHLAMLRTYIGGAFHPEAVDWSDEEMAQRSQRELAALLGISATPLEWRVQRYRKAMPLYRVGHGKRVATLEDHLSRWKDLAVIGNAFHGVGIPDCILLANRAMERLASSRT